MGHVQHCLRSSPRHHITRRVSEPCLGNFAWLSATLAELEGYCGALANSNTLQHCCPRTMSSLVNDHEVNKRVASAIQYRSFTQYTSATSSQAPTLRASRTTTVDNYPRAKPITSSARHRKRQVFRYRSESPRDRHDCLRFSLTTHRIPSSAALSCVVSRVFFTRKLPHQACASRGTAKQRLRTTERRPPGRFCSARRRLHPQRWQLFKAHYSLIDATLRIQSLS